MPLQRCLKSHTMKQARLTLLHMDADVEDPGKTEWYILRMCEVFWTMMKGKRAKDKSMDEFKVKIGRKVPKSALTESGELDPSSASAKHAAAVAQAKYLPLVGFRGKRSRRTEGG